MDRDIPPPEALTLLILLRRAGWSQKELAVALKKKEETVSDWIRTGRGLTPKRLRQAVRLLGFEIAEIGRTMDYLEGRRPGETEDLPGYAGLTPGELRLVHAARARVQESALAAVDAVLPRHLEEARHRRLCAEAEQHWKTLQSLPPEKQRPWIDQTPACHTPAMVARVCDESLRVAGRRADRALALAKLAFHIAERVPGEVSHRCQAYAKGVIANSLRVAGQLPNACTMFAEVRESWDSHTVSDPALREACLLGLEASLRRDQRRFEEARALLEKALALNDSRETINLLLEKSHLQYTIGHYQEAINTLGEVELRMMAPEKEPGLWFAVNFNRAANFTRLGQYQEAQKLLPVIWDLTESLDGGDHLLRLRWLAAEVAAGFGDLETPARSLEEVRKEFADQKNPFDAALVSLDLAEVYLKQGCWPKVRALAGEMIQIFQSQRVHREALTALLLFREAVEREDATLDLIRRLAQYLREARRDPSHHFEG